MDDRRGKGVIGDADNIVPTGNRRDGAEIRQLQQRVGRGFDPDHARIRPNGRFNAGQIVGLDPADPQPRAVTTDIFEQPPGAAVDIIDGHQMAVFIQQLEDGGNRRQP